MSANPDLKPLAGLFGKIITGKNIGEVILGKIINKGGFGVVYHGRRLYPAGPRSTHSARNKTQFAVKVTRHCDALLYHEAEHQWTVSGHPNVVSIYDVVEQTENFPGGKPIPLVFMILDLLEGGDLFDALTEIDGRSNIFWRNDELIRSVFIQLLDGIIYCHNKGIFHRDIKLENVLLSKDLTRVCISDFGLATNERLSSRHKMGSVNWLAPECHDESQSYFPPLSDIWALGILLICLLTNGILPWDTTECARPAGRKVVFSPTSGRTKRIPASISPELALDKHYSAFLASPTYFIDEYDISPRANALLRRMLRPEPFHRIPLALVRKEILELDTFFGQGSERVVQEMEMEMEMEIEPEYDTKVFIETKQRREKKEQKPDRKRSPTPSFPTFATRLEEQQQPQKGHKHRPSVAIGSLVSSKLSSPSSSSQSSAPPITPHSTIPLPNTDIPILSLCSDSEEAIKEKEKKKKKKKIISRPLPPAPTRAASRQVSPPLTGTSPTSIVMMRDVPPGAAAPTLSLTPPPPAHCRSAAAGPSSLPTKVGYITSTSPASGHKYNYRQHHKQYRHPRGTMSKIMAASLAAPAPAAPQYSVVETTVTRSTASALAAPTLSPIAARSPPRVTHLPRPQPLYIPSSSLSLPSTRPAAVAASAAAAYPSIPRSPPRHALSNLKSWFVRKRPAENLAQA